MARVENKKTSKARGGEIAMNIGRPSIAGNPYHIGRDGTRYEVIAKYRKRLLNDPALLQRIREEYATADVLLCYCPPLPCHGDVLLELGVGRQSVAA